MECGSVPFVSVDITITPKRKRATGERCCEPVALPDVDVAGAERIAAVAKALSDPIRVQLVDVLRGHAGEVCVCELEPLFAISQPTLSHHLRKLREAGSSASSGSACGPTTTSIRKRSRSCAHGCPEFPHRRGARARRRNRCRARTPPRARVGRAMLREAGRWRTLLLGR